jgi:putative membrane protein
MVFIDNLAYSLFSVSFAGFLLLYTVTSMYLVYRKRGKNFSEYLRAASVPLALIGTYMVIMGLWGQFTWPLPGSYNILFYDPLVSFGIVLLAFSISVKYKIRLEYSGFLALLVGIMIITYGIVGYNIGLTTAPIALLGLYFLYGLAAIFAYPVSLIADRLPGLKKNVWTGWHIILILFWILLLLASLLSAYTGIAAIGQHLISAP